VAVISACLLPVPVEDGASNSRDAGGVAFTIGNQKRTTDMAWFSPDKERDRFYLLPGMGGRALRRKKILMLVWAVSAGIIVSGTFAAVLWLMNRQ